MRQLSILLSFLLLPVFVFAQDSLIIPLWQGKAPLAKGNAPEDKPQITVFFPQGQSSHIAILVCPGGGYEHLAMDHEGYNVAHWLNQQGITAAVLRYRIDPDQKGYQFPAPFLDVSRAFRLLRSKAKEWKFDPDNMGVMGFSAGGHLASTLGTHFDAGKPGASDPIDRLSSRPDFMVLGYPVITLEDPYAHKGSRRALLGPDPNQSQVDSLSNEKMVTPQTPPTFLVCADDDHVVPTENSLMFYEALHKAHVPAVLHILAHGGHGFGVRAGSAVSEEWLDMLHYWLKQRGLVLK